MEKDTDKIHTKTSSIDKWLKKQIKSSRSDINNTISDIGIEYIWDKWDSIERFTFLKELDNIAWLKWTKIILAELQENWNNRADFIGIDKAYDILKNNKNAKIILISMIPSLSSLKKVTKSPSKLEFIMNHKNVRFLYALRIKTELEKIEFWNDKNNEQVNKRIYIQTMNDVAKQKILEIRHILQGVEDPYNPKSEWEKTRIKSAFEKTKKHFPWLDTKEKFLDFIVNIDIDIPEKMKWKKIEWVYCDIDWTLLEYVWIHSGKEWTQQLRQKVVDMLKKYEAEWKKIHIWTWWNVKMKETYLKSLWINRPVVNKYDYAWAEAEIVLDDTDVEAFILQSKIYPETYINTNTKTSKC